MLTQSFATASVAMLLINSNAANAEKPIPVTVVDPVVPVEISNADPIPVTGTVTLDAGDENVTVYDQFLTVDTPAFGNRLTGQLDVSAYKEVRLWVSRSSCSPCSQVEVSVSGVTAGGRSFPIDQYIANMTNTISFPFDSRTYSVPGAKMSVQVRNIDPGARQSVLVAIIGRAN